MNTSTCFLPSVQYLYNAVSIGHMYKTSQSARGVERSSQEGVLCWCDIQGFVCLVVIFCLSFQTQISKFFFHYLRKGLRWHSAYAWLNLVSGITGELYINRAEASIG